MNRPLSEIEMRACLGLARASQRLRDECIDIARTRSPSASFGRARRAAMLAGLDQMTALGIAKSTRWLAVIRRDHGDEKFEDVARTLAD